LKYNNPGMARTAAPKNSWMKNVTTWRKDIQIGKKKKYHSSI